MNLNGKFHDEVFNPASYTFLKACAQKIHWTLHQTYVIYSTRNTVHNYRNSLKSSWLCNRIRSKHLTYTDLHPHNWSGNSVKSLFYHFHFKFTLQRHSLKLSALGIGKQTAQSHLNKPKTVSQELLTKWTFIHFGLTHFRGWNRPEIKFGTNFSV